MRAREEIEKEFVRNLSFCTVETYGQNKVILETLLDIRELLKTKRKGETK